MSPKPTGTAVELDALGARLRLARCCVDTGDAERALSARELDGLAGLTKGHTALIESGCRPRIELGTATRLAKVLGVSLDWLAMGAPPAPEADAVVASVERARAERLAQKKPSKAPPSKRSSLSTTKKAA